MNTSKLAANPVPVILLNALPGEPLPAKKITKGKQGLRHKIHIQTAKNCMIIRTNCVVE